MIERLDERALDRLSEAICGQAAGSSAAEGRVARAMYALLGEGQQVSAARLAAVLEVEHAEAAALLARLPNVEHDEEGAVIGFGGLTLRPTPHRLHVEGRVRYAWCAWDALFLPVALGVDIDVRSRCGHTGRTVRLRVGPDGILERDPETLAVSFVQPAAVDQTDLRATFCGDVRFIADERAAETWRGQKPSGLVLSLDDAFELGRRMILERCGPG